jgi:hypothetical protein
MANPSPPPAPVISATLSCKRPNAASVRKKSPAEVWHRLARGVNVAVHASAIRCKQSLNDGFLLSILAVVTGVGPESFGSFHSWREIDHTRSLTPSRRRIAAKQSFPLKSCLTRETIAPQAEAVS